MKDKLLERLLKRIDKIGKGIPQTRTLHVEQKKAMEQSPLSTPQKPILKDTGKIMVMFVIDGDSFQHRFLFLLAKWWENGLRRIHNGPRIVQSSNGNKLESDEGSH